MNVFRMVIVLLCLSAFPAAACTLAGKYQTFALDPQGGFATTQSCQISVDLRGRVWKGFCNVRDEFGHTSRMNLTGGKWHIANCIVTGTLKSKVGTTTIEAAINGVTIVGRAHGGGALSIFAGVKVP